MKRPGYYRILIQDHLNPAWAEWFENMVITQNEDGTTTLSGVLVDQAALYGLLAKLRDLGLALLSINQVEPGAKDPDLGSPTQHS